MPQDLLNQFNNLLSYYSHLPQYSKPLRSLSDVTSLPIITRERLKHFDIRSAPVKPALVCFTSGTTSLPLEILFSKSTWDCVVERSKHILEAAADYSKPYVIMNCYGPGNFGSHTVERLVLDTNGTLIPIGLPEGARLTLARKLIMELRPEVVITCVSGCYDLFYDLPPKLVQSIICSGSPLTPPFRKKLEQMTLAKVVDYYGFSEVGPIAYGETEKAIIEKGLYIEVLQDNGSCSPTGEGQLIVTDLLNYSMPLIRYKVGDRVHIREKNKNKYLTFLKREDDMFNYNEKLHSKTYVTTHCQQVLTHDKFCFVMQHNHDTGKDLITLKIPLEDSHKQSLLKEKFKELGISGTIIPSTVFPKNNGGKYINFIDTRHTPLKIEP